MKIALVLDRFDRRLGGVEQWTAQLADGLLARGHSIHVVAKSIAARELRPGLTAHTLPARSTRLALADAAADVLRCLDVEIIHDMGFGWYCDVLQPHGGSRVAANLQNLNLSRSWARPLKQIATGVLPRYREFTALCERQYAKAPADRPERIVIAISEMVKADLLRHHALSPQQIRLVYNGVDTARFSPTLRAEERNRTRQKLGVSPDEMLCLIVAHNLELKGVPALLRAVTLLRSAGHKIVLAIVGGRRTSRYERMARTSGIQNCIRFVGAVDDPAPFYAAADLYVQPTWYDPCSLVVLEAMACGLPVVTTRFNGAGELIERNRTGSVLHDPGDEIELAAAIASWTSQQKRDDASNAARECMLTHTINHNIDAIVGVYEEILNARGRRVSRAA
jgi:UDP-glucose:(heptosyl)LPS alpha-1,3-glucosyltransferase